MGNPGFGGIMIGMKVSDRDVAYIADLASVELTEHESQKMLRDLNSILDHVAQLNELDTKDLPLTAHIPDSTNDKVHSGPGGSALRPDSIAPCLNRSDVLGSAPDTDGVYFRVPKVIER
jgi:aspartyl-tRNA(Asn)/glutamyl-tRNA(Gln) amidotransferase subunit C